MSDRTVIIQGTGLILPDEALQYLKLNSHQAFTIYSDDDIEGVIKAEYDNGVRQFVLTIISSQIMGIMPLIRSLPAAKFVATISTVLSLRGSAPNLYFSIVSNKYIELAAKSLEYVKNVTIVVYTNLSDPYIAEVVSIAEAYGYKTASIDDPTWVSYPGVIFITLPAEVEAWNQLISKLLPAPKTYNIFALENGPPAIAFPKNVLYLSIGHPSSTVQPQMNSYWNIATKSPQFSYGPSWPGPYPILINQRWKFLIKANLISTTNNRNNIYISRYLELTDLHPHFNLQNRHVLGVPSKLVWLISNKYYTKEARANLAILTRFNPKIKKIRVVSDFKCAVRKYWARGYRYFVLQCPSDDVLKVKKLNLCGGVFVCTRATAPSVRKPGSDFLFGLTDDTTMIQDEIAAVWRISNRKTVCLLGSSNNIDMDQFRADLDRAKIEWLNIDNIETLNRNTVALVVVGTRREYDQALGYIKSYRAQFPQLNKLTSYGRYVTRHNLITWKQLGMAGEVVTNNYNSSQPFLESEYSEVSRPLYFEDDIAFWDLSNVLLQFPLDFLFKFGYIVDL